MINKRTPGADCITCPATGLFSSVIKIATKIPTNKQGETRDGVELQDVGDNTQLWVW